MHSWHWNLIALSNSALVVILSSCPLFPAGGGFVEFEAILKQFIPACQENNFPFLRFPEIDKQSGGKHFSWLSRSGKITISCMENKLTKIGIQSPGELKEIVGVKSLKICQLVWDGRRPMSLKMAKKIKEKTGASLDYLLTV